MTFENKILSLNFLRKITSPRNKTYSFRICKAGYFAIAKTSGKLKQNMKKPSIYK